MTDTLIAIEGRAGRITLNRPAALNAVTHAMVLEIEAALDGWRDADVDVIILDAMGEKAFSAGGDIADIYAEAKRGNLEHARTFWRDEYRLNAKIAEYPKPIMSFLQGFVMGGGVGVGCHASIRIAGESTQIAMPECGIGLIPDIGGSMYLANAPGHVGAYLGTTGARMGAADAVLAGFADGFVPEPRWPEVKARLREGLTEVAFETVPDGALVTHRVTIDRHFGHRSLSEIAASLADDGDEFAQNALKALRRNAPLAMACCLEIVRDLRGVSDIREALEHEFRYTYRAVEQGDFVEGIRAAIIDKDRSPKWAHGSVDAVTQADVAAMLAPLGAQGLLWESEGEMA